MESHYRRALNKFVRIAVRESARFRSPIRVGVIGIGAIAPDHLDAYEGTGIAQVVAVCDVLPKNLAGALDRRPNLRSYRDYRQMLAEIGPDIVSICTWPQLHAEVVEAAAEAGVKGILCEKPLALQLCEVDRMRSACESRGVKLAGGHQYRFHANFMRAAEVIRSGGLGTINLVRGHIRSTLANNGPHLLDAVRFILGDVPAERVTCQCRRDRGEFNRGIPAEDSASGEIRFRGDVRFEIATGDLAPGFFAIEVVGTRGSLEVGPDRLRVRGDSRMDRAPSPADCRHRQFSEFVRWVKGQLAAYGADLEASAGTAELVLALYESARKGEPVELPLKNKGDVIGQLYPQPVAETGPKETVPRELPVVSAPGGSGDRLAMDGGRRVVRGWFSGKASIGAGELANLTRVIVSRNLNCVDGLMVPELERQFAQWYGSPNAVASTSGTAAIHVALGALNLNPGDEVITTPMTDMGTVIPILACNCLPVFADIDPVTGNLTAESIAQRITPRTRAVIVVHLFGQPAELADIVELVRPRGIPLVEDCSQAHAAEYQGKRVGTFGDLGCFSLQQSKQITCGDGGVTLINRPDLAERAALFVDKGWDRKRGLRAHMFLGMNYRMTELQGAVALAQLHKLAALVQSRRQGAERLSRQLRGLTGILPPPERPGVNSSWWMYAFRVDEDRWGVSSDAFAEALLVEGVRVRREYLPEPIFQYDVLKCQRTFGESRYPFSAYPYEMPELADFPGLQEFNRRLLLIPWSHNVRAKHADSIASAIRKVAKLLAECRASKELVERPVASVL
jgi:dTDP-4-amino-4,6-dideoxygalactose transaminase/predicted dehydrogenase